jgi:hypothetical protein
MSLWTPGGEHPVERESDQPERPTPPGAPDLESLSPEERAQAEALAAEMAEAQERLAETPANLVVANHLMGLYELAAIHLSQQPPHLDEARVAVDAMTAVVQVLEGRLGEAEPTLRDALSQIQMAWVELSRRAEEEAGGAPTEPAGAEPSADQPGGEGEPDA